MDLFYLFFITSLSGPCNLSWSLILSICPPFSEYSSSSSARTLDRHSGRRPTSVIGSNGSLLRTDRSKGSRRFNEVVEMRGFDVVCASFDGNWNPFFFSIMNLLLHSFLCGRVSSICVIDKGISTFREYYTESYRNKWR